MLGGRELKGVTAVARVKDNGPQYVKCQRKKNLERAESGVSHRYGADAVGWRMVSSTEMMTRKKDSVPGRTRI